MIYRCPKCAASDGLEVTAKVWVELLQDDADNIQTQPSDGNGDTEWDDEAAAVCTQCRWTGTVSDLKFELWDNNLIQFARLICEIVATQDNLDMATLAESMDLDPRDLNDLFDRADDVFERAKGNR